MNHNDVPAHLSQIHIRAIGRCPICLVAEATSFEDLKYRLEQALDLTNASIDTEQQVLLDKLNA